MASLAITASSLSHFIDVLSITTEKNSEDLDDMRQYAFMFTHNTTDTILLVGASASESVGGTFSVEAVAGALPKAGIAVPVGMLSLIKQATNVVGKDSILQLVYDDETHVLAVLYGEDEDDQQQLASFNSPEGSVWPVGNFKTLLNKDADEEPVSQEMFTKDQLDPLLKVSKKLKAPIVMKHGVEQTVSSVRIDSWAGWFLPDESNFEEYDEPDEPFIMSF